MPKLNDTHLPERLKEAIKQLEEGKEVEAKKNKTLLNAKQQQALVDAWDQQQELRKQHKPPKTEEEKLKIGWKDKREVRIDIYKQALAELEEDIFDIHLKQLEKEQAKATKAYLKGYFGATGLQDKDSAGKIAVARAGFTPNSISVRGGRDKEVRDIEEQLLKRFESEMTEEEREQLELLRETEKAERKGKKV
ncbi:2-hydroxyacyl-CoA dehydratase [Polynucleobacter sp. MWH-CaK5]|uniref:2-hydroxyacyl-CoA dehydratase family protein n=1 Tax=Polynucleobacter sp. MWH-CaK5 TaxID=2689107 RepID=UPI001BFD6A84|nr:2-hydroxyacyl-CoA dehydratase family protein [Polynucleobacter sp. MWH-CaK5]QWD88586.1 2-hydroxyacyl-CoA dehydratase [Polynucleobacter sp. MWH-CaK5]